MCSILTALCHFKSATWNSRIKMKIYIFSILYICLLFLCTTVQSNEDESQWLDVDAWSREPHDLSVHNDGKTLSSDCGQCKAERATDSTVALIYYRKFIKNLFNRQELKYDKSAAVYERTVYFSLNSKQLEQLENLKNARDLDMVLSEVLKNARTTTLPPAPLLWGVPALIWKALKALIHLLKISEVQFLLYAAVAMLLIWYVHRRYRINLVFVIVGVFLLSGYIITYLECNRELEAKHFLEKQQHRTKTENPPRWFNSILNLFGSADPKQEEQKNLIKNMSKLRLPFCRPDHVFMMLINDIFLKQLELLIEKTSATMLAVKTNLPFPFNYIAPLVLVILIGYILKLTFKYILSPRAWAPLFRRGSYVHSHSSLPQQQHQYLPANSGVANLTEDRISGENLRLLLDAVKRPVVVMQQESNVSLSAMSSSSGLQEIQEPTETSSETSLNATTNQDSTSNADSSIPAASNDMPSVANNNNNSKEESENPSRNSNTKL